MSIMRWPPFRELEDMSERLNRIFGRAELERSGGKDTLTATDWTPAVDIAETPEEFTVKAKAPDVRGEDLKVSIEQGAASQGSASRSPRASHRCRRSAEAADVTPKPLRTMWM